MHVSKGFFLCPQVCDNLINYDPTCTHFICERPNRGEKMLGCISSGTWALSIKYIEECSAKGAFLDEELYEWGNGKAYNIPKLSQEELIIAAAAHCWRKRLASDPGAGAFSGFRAIFRVSERHLNALKTVIKAGKGEVIEAQSPYSESPETAKATHCFVDVKKIPLTKNDYDFLKANGVATLSQMFINSYLMSGSDDGFSQYEIKM